jgi:hypothetical protein
MARNRNLTTVRLTAEDYARRETAEKLALEQWANQIARLYLLEQMKEMARDTMAQEEAIREDDDEEPIDNAELKVQWDALIEDAVKQGLKAYPNHVVSIRDKDGKEQEETVDI